MTKRERIGIEAGDYLRCPDRATARYRRVVRVGRRRDGTRYVVIRRSKFWRAFGLPPMERLEWGHIRALGYGLKKSRVPETIPALEISITAKSKVENQVAEVERSLTNLDGVIDALKGDPR